MNKGYFLSVYFKEDQDLDKYTTSKADRKKLI